MWMGLSRARMASPILISINTTGGGVRVGLYVGDGGGRASR